MNEFLDNQENSPEQEDLILETDPEQEDVQNPENSQNNEFIYNPVNYSHITPIQDYKPMSKGLKVFALVLAAVIALSSATLAGYYVGKNRNALKSVVKFSIDSQPINEKELTPAAVYEKVDQSVVGITIYNTAGKGGQASGIVYSKNGYIVTNDHIYSQIPDAKFKIHTHDGKEYDAKFIAGDVVSDLAVLKIDNNDLKPADFGNSDDSYIGQRVVAIGRPNDATDVSSITSGIISATKRRVANSSSYSARLIQTDTPINPGSSGGALVNMYGQVIGVTSSKLASVQHEGVGYAIPTTTLKAVVEELINEGRVVSRAKLGITYVEINSVTAEVNGIKNTGLQVESVTRDSDLYGKIDKGDIITKINDTDIKTSNTVLDIIDGCTAGDKITITVITSSGKTETFTAELRANVSKSSYTTGNSNSTTEEPSNGTFNFPSGE